MIFKLVRETQKTWHRTKGCEIIPRIIKKALFVDRQGNKIGMRYEEKDIVKFFKQNY